MGYKDFLHIKLNYSIFCILKIDKIGILIKKLIVFLKIGSCWLVSYYACPFGLAISY